MTDGALIVVDRLSQRDQEAAFGAGDVRGLGRRRPALRQAFEIDGHRLDVGVRQILQAVVDDIGHRPVDRAARRDPGLKQIGDILQAPVAESRLLVRGQRRRVPVLHWNQAALERFAIPSCRRAR